MLTKQDLRSPFESDHPDTADAVHDLISDVCNVVDSDAISATIEQIEWRSVPGFIPFTSGGYDGAVTYDLYSETSYAVERIAKILESDYEQMRSDFLAEHDVSADAEVVDHPEWERWQMDWEQGDPAYWFVKVRAIYYRADESRNDSGTDEVLFCLGVCDDLNYGRDHVGAWAGNVGTHWAWEETVPVADLTPEKLGEIHDAMVAAWVAA